MNIIKFIVVTKLISFSSQKIIKKSLLVQKTTDFFFFLCIEFEYFDSIYYNQNKNREKIVNQHYSNSAK
jgi:hypothetical protein